MLLYRAAIPLPGAAANSRRPCMRPLLQSVHQPSPRPPLTHLVSACFVKPPATRSRTHSPSSCAVNVLADHVAATDLSARHISELRRQMSEPDVELLRQLATSASARRRRRSMDSPRRGGNAAAVKRSKSLDLGHRPLRPREGYGLSGGWASPLRSLLRTTSHLSIAAASYLEASTSLGALLAPLDLAEAAAGGHGHSGAVGGPGGSSPRAGNSPGGASPTRWGGMRPSSISSCSSFDGGSSCGEGLGDVVYDAQPAFKDMVPW